MKSANDKPRGLIGWMASNSVAANLLMLVFLLGGLITLPRIRQEVFPEFDLDIVTVNVAYPGATPEDVEDGILLVLEEAIRGVDGVDRITSTANEGMGVVTAELLLDADGNEVLQDIKSEVDRIVTFPQDAERPVVQLSKARSRVLTILIHGPLGMGELKRLAERARDDLLQSPDISDVEISGIPPVEIAIEISQANLRAYGMTAESVAARLAQLSLDTGGGGIRTSAGEILLRLTDKLETAAEYRQTPLLATAAGDVVRIGDIGEVIDGFAETDEMLFFDGQPAVAMDIYRSGKERPLDISDAAAAFVAQFREVLPEGTDVLIASDRSDLYRERVALLLRNAALGLVLVMLILGLFLEVRLAFWVMLGIPVSFLGSLLFLPSTDVSINMISLFAFIISLGIVVDDAVVVGENVYHLRENGATFMRAAIQGARELAVPVLLSILTNIVAVMPLLMVPGAQGKIWRNIPIIMILVFTISLIESLFILPAHLGHQRPTKQTWFWRIVEAPQRAFGKGMTWFINNVYARGVRLSLRYRFVTIAVGVAALVLIIGYVRGGRIRFRFFPQVEADRVVVSAVLPYGAPIEASRAVAERLEGAAGELIAEKGGETAALGIQTSVGTQMRGGGPMGRSALSGSHLVGATVYLQPLDVRGFGAGDFSRQWRQAVGAIAGLESLSFNYSIGPSDNRPVDVQLSHRDPRIAEAAAADVASRLRGYAGVFEIDDGVAQGKPQIEFQISEEGRRAGLTSREVGRQVRALFFGAEVRRQQRGRDELKIMVRLPREERSSEAMLDQLVLRTPGGGEMSFKDAVSLVRGQAYDEINRDEGRRVISVTADVDIQQTSAGEVLAALRSEVMPMLQQQYPGLIYSFEGERREQRESFRYIGMGFLVAIFVIFALLAVPFKSYLQGLIVLSAVPFGVVGAIIGHLIMGYNLSFVSIMGIVALAGVVVNDNLILVDTINRLRAEGMSLEQAVAEGPIRRFRPVILTSMTTFFGLAPMIFEKSVQARFMIPMALSLGFGILYTTVIALLLVPSLYLTVEKMKLKLLRNQ